MTETYIPPEMSNSFKQGSIVMLIAIQYVWFLYGPPGGVDDFNNASGSQKIDTWYTLSPLTISVLCYIPLFLKKSGNRLLNDELTRTRLRHIIHTNISLVCIVTLAIRKTYFYNVFQSKNTASSELTTSFASVTEKIKGASIAISCFVAAFKGVEVLFDTASPKTEIEKYNNKYESLITNGITNYQLANQQQNQYYA